MSPLYSAEVKAPIALYTILERVAHEYRPTSYLEIGCREGDSLVSVLTSCESVRSIVVADRWDDSYGGTGRGNHEHIDGLLRSLNYQGTVLFLDGDSQKTLPVLSTQFDLILVDGDHSEEVATADLDNSWRLLRSGGVLVFDDLVNPVYPWLNGLFNSFVADRGAELLDSILIGVGAAAARKPVTGS